MALWATQLLTALNTRNISWGEGVKGGRCVGLTTLPPTCTNCLEIWEPQSTGTLRARPDLYRDDLLYIFWVPTKNKILLFKNIISELSDSIQNFDCFLKRYSCTGLNRPLGLKEVETSRISRRSAHESGPRHRQPLPPTTGDNPNTHFRQDHRAAGIITSLKISNNSISNGTRDLPACNAVRCLKDA
jgi:hypothetical protein